MGERSEERKGGPHMSQNGVTRYQRAVTDIYFPEGHVCCDLCPLLETYARKQCRRTGEYIFDSRATGLSCPLCFTERRDDLSAFQC